MDAGFVSIEYVESFIFVQNTFIPLVNKSEEKWI